MPKQSSCKHWLNPEYLAGSKHTQWHIFDIILSWYTYMNTWTTYLWKWHAFDIILSWYAYMNTWTTYLWNLVQVSKKRHMLIFARGFLVHRFIRKWVSKDVFLPSQGVTFGPSFSKTKIHNLSQRKPKSKSFKDKIEVLEIHLFGAHLLIFPKGDRCFTGLVYPSKRDDKYWAYLELRTLLGTWEPHVLLLGSHPIYQATEVHTQTLHIPRIMCSAMNVLIPPWQDGTHRAHHRLQLEETSPHRPKLVWLFTTSEFCKAWNKPYI